MRRSSNPPREIFRKSLKRLNALEHELYALRTPDDPSDDLRWLYDNLRLVRTELQDLRDGIRRLAKLPQVRTARDALLIALSGFDCGPRTAKAVAVSQRTLDYWLSVLITGPRAQIGVTTNASS